MQSITWTPVESKSKLEKLLVDNSDEKILITSSPNTWGFFSLPNGTKFSVGYVDLGLPPVACIDGDCFFVGIDEVLSAYNLKTLEQIFSYQMPTVFHEFIELSNSIVVRDEVGFISVSKLGEEQWKFLTDGPIDNFTFDGTKIRGVTIDDEQFLFDIPLN
jgi:hypothetical protein